LYWPFIKGGVYVIQIENECVDCGLPCIYNSCPYYRVPRFYCDECGFEAELFWFENKQLCIECIESRLEKVKLDD
jgi:hypothetical protein